MTIIVKMEELEPDKLDRACKKVIDALSDVPTAYKLGALHSLMESFPLAYIIKENPKKP